MKQNFRAYTKLDLLVTEQVLFSARNSFLVQTDFFLEAGGSVCRQTQLWQSYCGKNQVTPVKQDPEHFTEDLTNINKEAVNNNLDTIGVFCPINIIFEWTEREITIEMYHIIIILLSRIMENGFSLLVSEGGMSLVLNVGLSKASLDTDLRHKWWLCSGLHDSITAYHPR